MNFWLGLSFHQWEEKSKAWLIIDNHMIIFILMGHPHLRMTPPYYIPNLNFQTLTFPDLPLEKKKRSGLVLLLTCCFGFLKLLIFRHVGFRQSFFLAILAFARQVLFTFFLVLLLICFFFMFLINNHLLSVIYILIVV